MHLGFFSFVYLSQLSTLGWRSSCLRRPVFSCRVSLCGLFAFLFVTLQTIFLISDCWLQCTTKKVPLRELSWDLLKHFFFSMAHLSSVALLSVFFRRPFFRSQNKLFWPRVISFALLTSGMTEDGARKHYLSLSWVCVFLSQFAKSGLALKVSLGFW